MGEPGGEPSYARETFRLAEVDLGSSPHLLLLEERSLGRVQSLAHPVEFRGETADLVVPAHRDASLGLARSHPAEARGELLERAADPEPRHEQDHDSRGEDRHAGQSQERHAKQRFRLGEEGLDLENLDCPERLSARSGEREDEALQRYPAERRSRLDCAAAPDHVADLFGSGLRRSVGERSTAR